MKSRVGMRLRLGGHVQIGPNRAVLRGGAAFSLAFGDVALLIAEGVGGRDRLPRASPTTFPPP